jgi:hypothetical protein
VKRPLMLAFVFAGVLAAADMASLPRDPEKEAWVRARLAELGFSNEIRVVREEGLKSGNICAYATVSGGARWISYDPSCVTSLDPRDRNYIWSAGTMFHEIAHHLASHPSTLDQPALAEESESERWVGWMFRFSSMTLDQAMIYARAGGSDANHPSLDQRIRLVETGWRNADAVLSGKASAVAPPGVSASKLAETARQRLKSLASH